MPTDDTLPSRRDVAQPSPALPENHLAVVIEDLLTAVDEGLGIRSPQGGPDLRAVVIYGWAIGAFSARDVASGASTDEGLAYLWRGTSPSFGAVRGIRQSDLRRLELQLATAFDLCRAAGFPRLGDIDLEDPPAGAQPAPFSAPDLVRDLLARSKAADEEEDRELAAAAGGLPVGLTSRDERLRVFRSFLGPRAAGSKLGEPDAPAASQPWEIVGKPGAHPPRRRALRQYVAPARALATIVAILVGGLLLVRWVGATLASPPAQGRAGRLEESLTVLAPPPLVAQEDSSEVPPEAIRDEAFRLAGEALENADLEAALDLYVLAAEAMPGDREALDRRHQVETALGITARRDSWAEAVTDLAELRRAAPSSTAVLTAYVEALVGAGRAAQATGASGRGLDLCREAARLMPSHAGAQACAGSAVASPALPSTPTPPPAPTARPTPVALTPAVPIGALPAEAFQGMVSPGRGRGERPDPAREPLSVWLLGSCAAAGGAFDRRVVRASGMVSGGGSQVTDFEIEATVRGASGEIVTTVRRAYSGPGFSLEQTVGRGPHVLAVVVSKDGLPSGGGVARVTC